MANVFRKFAPDRKATPCLTHSSTNASLHSVATETSHHWSDDYEEAPQERSRIRKATRAVTRSVQKLAGVISGKATKNEPSQPSQPKLGRQASTCTVKHDVSFNDEVEYDDRSDYKDFCQMALGKPEVKKQQHDFIHRMMNTECDAPENPDQDSRSLPYILSELSAYREALLQASWDSLSEQMRVAKLRISNKEKSVQEMRKQTLAMQAALLHENSRLRDEIRGTPAALAHTCEQLYVETSMFLEKDTRDLVQACLAEQVKHMVAVLEKDEDSELGCKIREKIEDAVETQSKPLREKVEKIQGECLEIKRVKHSREADIYDATDLLFGSPLWRNELSMEEDETWHDALAALRGVRGTLDETVLDAKVARQEVKEFRLESERARQDEAALAEKIKVFESEAAAWKDLIEESAAKAAEAASRVPTEDVLAAFPSEGELEVSQEEAIPDAAERDPSCWTERRPLLPGAPATATLAHAEELKVAMQSDVGTGADFVNALGTLGDKSDSEYTRLVGKLPADQAIRQWMKRLDIARLECAALRKCCVAFLEELIAVRGFVQGAGQPQGKLNMVSKRLQLSMEVVQTNLSSCLLEGQRGLQHVDELHRLASARPPAPSSSSTDAFKAQESERKANELLASVASSNNSSKGARQGADRPTPTSGISTSKANGTAGVYEHRPIQSVIACSKGSGRTGGQLAKRSLSMDIDIDDIAPEEHVMVASGSERSTEHSRGPVDKSEPSPVRRWSKSSIIGDGLSSTIGVAKQVVAAPVTAAKSIVSGTADGARRMSGAAAVKGPTRPRSSPKVAKGFQSAPAPAEPANMSVTPSRA